MHDKWRQSHPRVVCCFCFSSLFIVSIILLDTVGRKKVNTGTFAFQITENMFLLIADAFLGNWTRSPHAAPSEVLVGLGV